MTRSRTFWPAPLTVAGVGEGHDHKLTGRWKLGVTLAVVILATNVALSGLLFWYVLLSEQYAADQRQDVRDAICDVLEQFPPGPVMDDVRDRNGCGPGRPVDDFPPEVRDRIGQPAPPAPLPEGVETAPPGGFDLPPGAEADREGAEPYFPPPGGAPDPAHPDLPPAYPDGPLDPLTDLVCDTAHICLDLPLGGTP